MAETINYKKWSEFFKTGICEEDLKVIEGQLVPLKYKSIFEYEEMMLAGL